jgi:hypothetical protein
MNHSALSESMDDTPIHTRALVVLGPFRGGTSVTCGVLHQLGVFVGRQFFDAQNRYCTYEAVGLRRACNLCFDENPTGWNYLGNRQRRVSLLSGWMDYARREAAVRGCCGVGGKHPTLCKLVHEAAQAFRNQIGQPPLFLSVIRPIDQVLAGWEKAVNDAGRPWWRRPDREQIVRDLVESRDEALKHHEHFRLPLTDLRNEPEATITRLAEHCGLPLTHLDRATRLIRSP